MQGKYGDAASTRTIYQPTTNGVNVVAQFYPATTVQVQNGTTEELKCGNCCKIYTSRDDFTQHLPTCRNVVQTASIIYTTPSNALQYPVAQQFQCHICHKLFMSIYNLNTHMKIHEPNFTATTATAAQTTVLQTYPIIVPVINSTQSAVVPNVTIIKDEYKCQFCQKEFTESEQLGNHMKLHEFEFRNRALYQHNVYQTPQIIAITTAPISSQSDDTKDGETGEKQPVEEPLKLHKCPFCHKMFENIVEHLKIHESEYKSQQQTSTEEAPEPSNTNSKVHECFVCQKRFSTAGNLGLHIKIHSGEKPFKCKVCGKGFIQSNNLATHMKTHTGERPHECSICKKRFSQSNNLKTHIRTHTGERPFACTLCDKRFNQKNNLTTHMRTHTLICTICGVQFMHPNDLANHMKFHNDEKPYICSVCNKVYINFEELSEHMKTHTQNKPHQCHICEKQFTQSNNLKTHMKTHIFQDPHKCHMCSRSFQTIEEFSQHILVHTADKPYECTYCGKRFIQSNNLKTHVRTHTGEKPFQCMCGKRFNQKNNLNTHMRIHTGEKPFECTICGKRFNQSNNLNKHIKTHIGQDMPES